MDMRHHVDLGSNEISGCLGHFIISLAFSVHLLRQLTLRLERGTARVKIFGDTSASREIDEPRPPVKERGAVKWAHVGGYSQHKRPCYRCDTQAAKIVSVKAGRPDPTRSRRGVSRAEQR
jgi:hypothetical protein